MSPIGSGFSIIDKVTTIDQTGCSRLIYACKDLHARLHGSIDRMDITNNGIIYESVGITNATLSLTTTGPSYVVKDGDVMVAFDNAVFFKHLHKALFACGHDDLPVFENMLATHILHSGTTPDLVRCNTEALIHHSSW